MNGILWFIVIIALCVIASGIFGLVNPPKLTQIQATVVTAAKPNYTVSYTVNNIKYTSKLQSNNNYTVNQVITVYYNSKDMTSVIDNPTDMKKVGWAMIACGIVNLLCIFAINKYNNNNNNQDTQS